KEDLTNVKIKVFGYGSELSENIIRQELKTYKYFEINAESLLGKLEMAKMTIQVEKDWVAENNLTKDGVSLFKLDATAGKWNQLDTTYKTENNDYYYYQTELTSFSIFSISEKSKGIVREIVEQITQSYDEASKTLLGLLIWWTLVLILIVAILLTIVLVISLITAEFKEHFLNANFIKINHQLKK
ncbi:MAG: PGF-pre-PGF domain-containing protein, partial [Nanoarchaeota archaeon]